MAYLKNDTVCRNRQLAAYFGEEDMGNCGLCDICRMKDRPSHWPGYEQAAIQIRDLIGSTDALDLSEIEQRLDLGKERLAKTLEMMVEKKWIRLNLQNKFELIQ